MTTPELYTKMQIKMQEESTTNENEKEAYQRLINEYYALVQHCEEPQRQLDSQQRLGGHHRNISDVSSISGMDECTLNNISIPENHGYGSVRSTASTTSLTREKVDQIEWKVGDGSRQKNRLTQENLQLIDKDDLLNESIKKLARQNLKEESTSTLPVTQRSKSNIRKKDREYLGMFSIREGEETLAINGLVIDLKPRTAVNLLPALPSYILFMCIRHADYMNDEEKVILLLSSFIRGIRKVVRTRTDDFETQALWLSNLLRFVCTLKQYSGERAFQNKNTPKQNEQCLRNFDLSDYRTVASDTATWIFQEILKVLEHKVHPLIVPGVLEYDVSGGINVSSTEVNYTRPLCKELTGYYKILQFYGVCTKVISQIFKQLYYFMCASSLNNLLLRKELCNWSKGYQIMHNLSHLEMWTREKNLDEESIKSMLQPIIQAAQLLQARKSNENVASICEMCSALTPLQISKILTLYTPIDQWDQRVSPAFIRKVQEKLQEKGDTSGQQTLLMDIKHTIRVSFYFSLSDICLEDIEIPEVLNLPMLEKI